MILLTGTGGFIGKHLVEFITSQYPHIQLVALTNSNIKNVHCINHNEYTYDLSNFPKKIIKGIEVIVHLGAFIPKSRMESDDIIMCNKNISSTQSLLGLELPSLKKVVYISSIDVYDNTNHIIDERTATKPGTLYGWSKLYCEKMVQSRCDALNIETTILRLGHVYGPGEEFYQKLMPVTMKTILAGQSPVVFGDGSDLRSFIYVGDVVRTITAAIENQIDANIINVVHHESHTILETVQKIIAISHKNISIQFKAGSSIKRNLMFDNGRLRKKLCPSLTNIDEGLKLEWQHISQNG
jgi:nucleoside-diphosphate-sugar epimerase